jgi:DNA-binding transcriptional ArsR family regulator
LAAWLLPLASAEPGQGPWVVRTADFGDGAVARAPAADVLFTRLNAANFALNAGEITFLSYSCNFLTCSESGNTVVYDAVVTLANAQSGGDLWVQAAGPIVLSTPEASMAPGMAPSGSTAPQGVGFSMVPNPLAFAPKGTDGAPTLSAASGGQAAADSAKFFLTGADFHYAGRAPEGNATEGTVQASQTGIGSGATYEYVVAYGTGAVYTVAGEGQGFLPGADSPTVVSGTGTLTLDNGTLSFQNETAYAVQSVDSGQGGSAMTVLSTPTSEPIQAAAAPTSDSSQNGAELVAAGAALGFAALGGGAALLWYWPRIRFAATLFALPLYTRIGRESVMEQGTRERIYGIIREDPGVHAHLISARAGVGWGTTVYHLKLLEDHQLVVSERQGRYKRFFPSAGFVGVKGAYGVLRNPTSAAIAEYVQAHPGANQRDVCAGLSLSPSLVSWHVERLEQAALLKRVREGRVVRYYAGPAWAAVAQTDGPPAPVAMASSESAVEIVNT